MLGRSVNIKPPLQGCIFTSMMYSSQNEGKVDALLVDQFYVALNLAFVLIITVSLALPPGMHYMENTLQ